MQNVVFYCSHLTHPFAPCADSRMWLSTLIMRLHIEKAEPSQVSSCFFFLTSRVVSSRAGNGAQVVTYYVWRRWWAKALEAEAEWPIWHVQKFDGTVSAFSNFSSTL